MTPPRETIALVGAGRMGRGMAIAFAYGGHEVALIDAKPREPAAFTDLKIQIQDELRATLTMLAGFAMLNPDEVDSVLARVTVLALENAATPLADADVIFEGVPEVIDIKRDAFTLISTHARDEVIIASTTSTILSDELQGFVSHPGRFLNAHWLNPAFLVPLVELSPGKQTDPAVTSHLKSLLERMGKVPVVCAASPGYIVPRIQALAMNEAARIVEEGVASAEDVDKATKYGFGFRFAVLGLPEFIDWGGGDILFHASQYLSQATGQDRYNAPQIIRDNMKAGRNGLRDGQGFLDYSDLDIPTYQRDRLGAFVAMLRHLDKMPPKG